MATPQQKIINGDSAEVLKTITSNTIDAVITDPPYGIEFLAKDWDRNTGAVEIWQECLRILKPGGFLLAFSAARTYHNLATNIESAGFEIRDQIMWLYASGFPKAQQIKDFPGWKTQLKPAHEPICMARKPVKGAQYQNMAKWGVGALNIDATRIPFENNKDFQSAAYGRDKSKTFGYINTEQQYTYSKQDIIKVEANQQGRYPSNVIGEVEGYQKYFYCPKVSRKERHRGFEQIPDPISNYSLGDVKNHPLWDPSIGTSLQRLKHKIMEHNRDVGPKLNPLSHIPTNPEGMYNVDGTGVQYNSNKYKAVGNNHPTVKPVELMKYLVKLVTPEGAHIVDPFAGSGSTGMACKELGRSFTGIDLDANYCDIATRRIEATKTDPKHTLFE